MSDDQPLTDLLLRMGLIAPEDLPAITRIMDTARASVGLDDHDLLGAAQGVGRGVERVALALGDLLARRLADRPLIEREADLDELLVTTHAQATEVFSIMLTRRLETIARRRIATPGAARHPSPLDAAFVDLRESTAFMLDASVAEIEALSDELYAVGQEIASRHDIAAGKFLGDGILLLGSDPVVMLAATAEAVVALGARTPLRAGAGIARGPVIRRGGDWLGPPVNLAARLAELAAAGEVLVDREAIVPALAGAPRREVLPRGLDEVREVAVLMP